MGYITGLTPIATGGNQILFWEEDDSKIDEIHVFTSSGTFTIVSSITAKTLIVGGGGNGAVQRGGNGGQVLEQDINIATGNYSVTVGGGNQSSSAFGVTALTGGNSGGLGGGWGLRNVNAPSGRNAGCGMGSTVWPNNNGSARRYGGGGGSRDTHGGGACPADNTPWLYFPCDGGGSGCWCPNMNADAGGANSGGGGGACQDSERCRAGGSGVVVVRFPYLQITTSKIGNGTINPSIQNLTPGGNSLPTVITPDTNWYIYSVTVDGIVQSLTPSQIVNGYTVPAFINVQESHTIDAEFKNGFVISASKTGNGTISPTQYPNYGSNVTVSFAPNHGSYIKEIWID